MFPDSRIATDMFVFSLLANSSLFVFIRRTIYVYICRRRMQPVPLPGYTVSPPAPVVVAGSAAGGKENQENSRSVVPSSNVVATGKK